MFGRRRPQPALLREPCLVRRDQHLPPAFQQFTVDLSVNAPGQRRFILPGGAHDGRAQRSFMHDDQLMVVQPAARKDQQSLPIAGTRQLLPQRAYQRTTLWLTQPMKTQYFAGQLLMLKQCLAAPVHRAQRSQIRRCDMELLTEMPPEHRWHDAHRIEYSATHAQEPHLQRQPQLELRPTAFFNDLAFGRREPKKRHNLEGRQFARELLQTQKRGLPVVHRTLLKPGAIASLKSRTASSCFYLGRAREALQLPRNPTASYCTKN